MSECKHISTTSHDQVTYCIHCGIRTSLAENPVKTTKLEYQVAFNPASVLKAYEKATQKPKRPTNSFYLEQRPYIVRNIFEWGSKLKLTTNAIHLAIILLDQYSSSIDINTRDEINLTAATSLMVAAKAIELDDYIPPISKVLKVSNVLATTSEVRKMELNFCFHFNWQLQIPTLLDYVEYFLSQGAIFQSDRVSSTQEPRVPTEETCHPESPTSGRSESPVLMETETPITEILIDKIEKDALKLATFLISEPSIYYGMTQKMLAGGCIAFSRSINNLYSWWVSPLQELFSLTQEQIKPLLDLLITLFGPKFSRPGDASYPIVKLPSSFSKDTSSTKNLRITPRQKEKEREPILETLKSKRLMKPNARKSFHRGKDPEKPTNVSMVVPSALINNLKHLVTFKEKSEMSEFESNYMPLRCTQSRFKTSLKSQRPDINPKKSFLSDFQDTLSYRPSAGNIGVFGCQSTKNSSNNRSCFLGKELRKRNSFNPVPTKEHSFGVLDQRYKSEALVVSILSKK